MRQANKPRKTMSENAKEHVLTGLLHRQFLHDYTDLRSTLRRKSNSIM